MGSVDLELCVGSHGKTLFATTDHLGQHPLWAIDAGTGRASAITGEGNIENFDVGPRQVFYTHSTLANPPDMFAVGFAGGKTLELTHLNQATLDLRKMSDD